MSDSVSVLALDLGLRTAALECLSKDFLRAMDWKSRISFILQRIRALQGLVLEEGLDSIYGDNSRFDDCPNCVRLGFLVDSIPNCKGCELNEQETVSLGVPFQSALLLAPSTVCECIVRRFKLSNPVAPFGKQSWRRSASEVQKIVQSKKELEKSCPHSVTAQIGRSGNETMTLYKIPKDVAPSTFKLVLNEDSLPIKFAVNQLFQGTWKKEGLKRGKLRLSRGADTADEAIAQLDDVLNGLCKIIDDCLISIETRMVIFGSDMGDYIGKMHDADMLHGDLHMGNVLVDPSTRKVTAILDLEDSTCILRSLTTDECVGDIVTLFAELSPTEWKAFSDAYVRKRGETGQPVIRAFEQ